MTNTKSNAIFLLYNVRIDNCNQSCKGVLWDSSFWQISMYRQYNYAKNFVHESGPYIIPLLYHVVYDRASSMVDIRYHVQYVGCDEIV